jgi:hypothetical protein
MNGVRVPTLVGSLVAESPTKVGTLTPGVEEII